MIPAPDEETLARAILTYCQDGADAVMFATIKGASDAVRVLRLLSESVSNVSAQRHGATATLERNFLTGIARWGRKADGRASQAFHTALARWQHRLAQLPTLHPPDLADLLTSGGTQWIIAPHSAFWPSQLTDLSTRKDWAAPLCLWGVGAHEALTSCDKPVAVVGSRNIDDYGRHVACGIAEHAAAAGHLVISGGAFGADACAHQSAIAAMRRLGPQVAGRTVAVFAGGLNHIGPERNMDLFEGITANRGVLISELCPDTIPEAHRFLLRNRIIAALASSVVVTQARLRSGALNTANWAVELSREVYAAPGRIDNATNAGCNALIHDAKAIILCSAESVGQLMHQPHPPRQSNTPSHIDPQTAGDAPPWGGGTNSGHIQRAAGSEQALSPSQQVVASAIRRCRRLGKAATLETLLAERQTMRKSASLEPFTSASLMVTLGEMELLGLIDIRAGGITLATGSG